MLGTAAAMGTYDLFARVFLDHISKDKFYLTQGSSRVGKARQFG